MAEEISPLENHGWWMEQLRKDAKANRPEALRLADALILRHGVESFEGDAAAELRRLHAENEDLKRTLAASCDEERNQLWEAGPGGGCARALSAEFRCAELLEALKIARPYVSVVLTETGSANAYHAERQVDIAIARAEGEPK